MNGRRTWCEIKNKYYSYFAPDTISLKSRETTETGKTSSVKISVGRFRF